MTDGRDGDDDARASRATDAMGGDDARRVDLHRDAMMTMTMTMKTTWAMETMETAERTETTATAMDGRTKNYFSTLDERELFDALRERTVVLGLFGRTANCLRRTSTSFDQRRNCLKRRTRRRRWMRRRAWCSSKFRTRATPNATAALNATNAPFVTILKKNRWYYVAERRDKNTSAE